MRSCARVLFLGLLCSGCSVEADRRIDEVGVASLSLHHRSENATRKTLRRIGRLATVDTLAAAINAHDAARFARVHSEAGSLDVVGMPISEGRAAIAARLNELFAGFGDAEFGFDRIWLHDDAVIAEWVLRGTHTGAIGSIPPTEGVAGVRGASVMTFDARGKVRNHVVYFDGVTVLSQLGIQAGPARPVADMPVAPEVHHARARPSARAQASWSQAFYDAFESGDAADITPLLASDLLFENLVEPGPRVGRDAFIDLFTDYTTAFPDCSIAKAGEWYIGDTAIVENVVDATHLGPLGPIPATSRPVHLRFLDIVDIDEGRMTVGHTYTNYLDLFQQLGL